MAGKHGAAGEAVTRTRRFDELGVIQLGYDDGTEH
jgi:hypothetical protein